MIVYDEDSLFHYGRKGMKWYQHIFTKEERAGRSLKRNINRNLKEIDRYWKRSNKLKKTGPRDVRSGFRTNALYESEAKMLKLKKSMNKKISKLGGTESGRKKVMPIIDSYDSKTKVSLIYGNPNILRMYLEAGKIKQH